MALNDHKHLNSSHERVIYSDDSIWDKIAKLNFISQLDSLYVKLYSTLHLKLLSHLFHIFVQLGFSSKDPLQDNFRGILYSNSLVAKPLSDLYYDSSSNF